MQTYYYISSVGSLRCETPSPGIYRGFPFGDGEDLAEALRVSLGTGAQRADWGPIWSRWKLVGCLGFIVFVFVFHFLVDHAGCTLNDSVCEVDTHFVMFISRCGELLVLKVLKEAKMQLRRFRQSLSNDQ